MSQHSPTAASTDRTPANCDFCAIEAGADKIGDTNPLLERSLSIPLQTEWFIVFPDAAPIAPRHSLIVPRHHALSFGRLTTDAQAAAIDLATHIATQFDHPADHDPVIFEHGSREASGDIGCSITHAHLHVLFLPSGTVDNFEFHDEFDAYPTLWAGWEAMGANDYYLFGELNNGVQATVVQEDPALACSMFLRKRFAGQLGRPDLANYRRYQSGEPDDMLPEVGRTQDALLEMNPPR